MASNASGRQVPSGRWLFRDLNRVAVAAWARISTCPVIFRPYHLVRRGVGIFGREPGDRRSDDRCHRQCGGQSNWAAPRPTEDERGRPA